MAMTYTSLTGSKSSVGSIRSWVSYTKLDAETIVDEAQSLIFQSLRTREMRTEWTFGMAVGQSEIALPARFLDPIGRLFNVTDGFYYKHRIETDIAQSRAYDSSVAGSFGTNPFTTTLNSSLVNVQQTAHGINQGSTITIAGAVTSSGLSLNDTFPVVAVVDANNFTIDTGDQSATSAVTDGGSSATYTANNLIAASPNRWAIWDEKIKFDTAFDVAKAHKLLYYRSPLPLSATNPSNWLVVRYPNIVRVACLAMAATFMKDDEEFQKQSGLLGTLIQATAAENDLGYRGMEFETETP